MNRYYGWYVESGQLDLGLGKLEQELDAFWEQHGKAIIITEFGADTLASLHSFCCRAGHQPCGRDEPEGHITRTRTPNIVAHVVRENWTRSAAPQRRRMRKALLTACAVV
jgi:hypothetical protein